MKRILTAVLFLFLSFSCLAHEKALEVYRFFKDTEYNSVAHIIVAQGALESAWYRNKGHVLKNNYFSILDTKKKGCQDNQVECMFTYKSLEDSCQALLKLLRSRKYSTDVVGYWRDLEDGPGGNRRLRYATDVNYVKKVRGTVKALQKHGVLTKEEICQQEMTSRDGC